MGRKQYGIRTLKIEKLDAGFFPNLDLEDVPEGGFPEAKHVIHRRSGLIPFPGMDLVNATKAGFVQGQGVHYIDLNEGTRRICVFGQGIFSETGGTLTDITGGMTIGNGNLFQFTNYQLGSNQYAIGAQGGGNPPIVIETTGNAALLAGSPPNFETVSIYHEALFGSVGEALYWSDPGAVTTFTTSRDVTFFKRDIKCIFDHGSKLAVMMADRIGSIQGFDRLDYVQNSSEVENVGAVGKLAAIKCFWGQNNTPVIATVAKSGVWLVDEAFNTNKILGDNYFDEFNQSQLSKSSIAYWADENLLFVALPYAASTEPDYLIIINTKTGAFWPAPEIHGNYIKAMASMRDADGKEFIYYQDNNGYLFKFNFATNSYHTGEETQEINYRAKTRRYDLDDVHSLGELVMLAGAVGNWGINVAVNFGFQKDDGTAGAINFSNNEDVLGDDFVLGASTLGGSDYIFEPLEGVGGFGRFIQITFYRQSDEVNDVIGSSFTLGQSRLGAASGFNIKKLEVHLHRHRRGGNDQ